MKNLILIKIKAYKKNLINISDISNINNKFIGFNSLSSLTDLSIWNNKNVNSFIFYIMKFQI